MGIAYSMYYAAKTVRFIRRILLATPIDYMNERTSSRQRISDYRLIQIIIHKIVDMPLNYCIEYAKTNI